MTERLYVAHENHLGELRFQPRLDTGERFWGSVFGKGDYCWRATQPNLIFGGAAPAYLCRSRRKAERTARREMRRRERARRNDFKEVKDA